ncbi:MAG: DNA primase [Bryobacterales bacterium]|nr:DNA primase [Bryobacteraceae bacterium]MDW8353481.1 DNA primase [Bryobacterales bacterium]
MDFVEHLKSSLDIVKVIGEYVRLKRAGSGPRYVGLCPFHTEKTPSFSVHQGHQFYKCFGCGAGGDVIRFVMEIERLSFFEALKLLAERYGIPMPQREYSDAETRLRAAVYRMHEIAAQVFRGHLEGPEGAEARRYLESRGVDPGIAAEFGLGLADRSGTDLVRRFEREGFSAEQMDASGLVLRREGGGFYDRFRGRLMFPIHSESGKVIAFAGRALSAEDEPKYMNSPETPIYRKSHVLYNLHRAKDAIRRLDRSILVEGYMDVIGLEAAGVRGVVASCGTALTASQVRLLRRHSENVVVNFDPDAAGGAAAERSIQVLLEEGLRVRVLELEDGLDPDEFVRRAGAEAYGDRLTKAPGYFYWLADRARAKYDVRTAEGRAGALRFLLPAVHRVSDRLERAAIASEIAAHLGVETGLLVEHFRKAAVQRSDQPLRQAVEPVRPVEKILLNALLASEEARRELIPQLRGMRQVAHFVTGRIFQALFALAESGQAFSFAALEGRLEERDRELLASVIFADETGEEACSLEQARACVARLAAEERAAQRAALRARVREAERAGDLAEALRLTEELNRLERSERRSGTVAGVVQ